MTLKQRGFSHDVTWKDFWTQRTRLSYIYIMLMPVVVLENLGGIRAFCFRELVKEPLS